MESSACWRDAYPPMLAGLGREQLVTMRYLGHALWADISYIRCDLASLHWQKLGFLHLQSSIGIQLLRTVFVGLSLKKLINTDINNNIIIVRTLDKQLSCSQATTLLISQNADCANHWGF